MTQAQTPAGVHLQRPVEVRPDAGVFLSPRVVDQQAFEDYAQRLRSLIQEATDAGSALDEIKTLRTESTASLTRQKAVLEAGAKLVKAVDAKRAQLDETRTKAEAVIARLEAAADRAARASEDVDARLDAIVEQRIAALEASMDERVRTITDQIESKLTERVESMSATLGAIDEQRAALEHLVHDATENTLCALKDANQRAAKLAGWDPDDIVDGAGVGQPSRDSLADLLLRAEAMQERSADAMQRLTALRDESKSLVDAAAVSLDGARDDLLRIDRERELVEERVAKTSETTEALRERTKPLIDVQERAEKTTTQLASLLAQSRSAREEEQHAAGRLDEAVDHARQALIALEPWKDVCFADRVDAERVQLPPVLEEIARKFRSGLAQDVQLMARALSDVAQRSNDDLSPR